MGRLNSLPYVLRGLANSGDRAANFFGWEFWDILGHPRSAPAPRSFFGVRHFATKCDTRASTDAPAHHPTRSVPKAAGRVNVRCGGISGFVFLVKPRPGGFAQGSAGVTTQSAETRSQVRPVYALRSAKPPRRGFTGPLPKASSQVKDW